MSRRTQQGFTLMELLVALFVFSLLTAFAFRATSIMSSSAEALEQEQRSLMDLQKVVHFIENDIKRLGLQDTTGQSDDPLASSSSFLAEDQEEESRISLAGGIAYYIQEGTLFRESSVSDENKQPMKMLSEVDAITMNYTGNDADQALDNNLPMGSVAGVEFSLQHQQFGLIRRVIYLGYGQVDDNELAQLKGRLLTPEETPGGTGHSQSTNQGAVDLVGQ